MRITDRAMKAIRMGLTLAEFTGTPAEDIDAQNALTDIEDLVPDACELCGAHHDNGTCYCDKCGDAEMAQIGAWEREQASPTTAVNKAEPSA